MASAKVGWPKAFPKGDYEVTQVVAAGGADPVIVAAHWTADGMTRISKAEPKGVATKLPAPVEIPRRVDGLWPTAEGTFVLHTGDRRIFLCDGEGKERASFSAPWLRNVVSFLGHPTRPEVALVWDEASVGSPTTARLYRLTAEQLLAGREPTLLATRPFRPAIAFDSEGALVAVDSGTIHTYADDQTVPDTAPIQWKHGGPQIAARLTASGDRVAMIDNPMGGEYFVADRAGNVLRSMSGLLLEQAALIEGGKSLLLTAEAAKSRTGSAAWVTWPDPRMLESYVAVMDVDSGSLRGLVARSAGSTRSLAVIEGEIIAVASYGRSRKVELFPWAAVAG